MALFRQKHRKGLCLAFVRKRPGGTAISLTVGPCDPRHRNTPRHGAGGTGHEIDNAINSSRQDAS